MKDKEITELAKANSRWDHKKIILLSFAVALSVFVLFSAFSIAKGKIAVDTVKNIRESGNAVAVYLENASKRQYDQMIYPDYIEDYGWQYSIGDWQQEGKFLASCKVVDQTVWEKMIRPAYDHIVGNYPKSENDIMMSRSLLKNWAFQIRKQVWKYQLRFYLRTGLSMEGKNLRRNSLYLDITLIILIVLFIFQQYTFQRNIWI